MRPPFVDVSADAIDRAPSRARQRGDHKSRPYIGRHQSIVITIPHRNGAHNRIGHLAKSLSGCPPKIRLQLLSFRPKKGGPVGREETSECRTFPAACR